MNIRHGLLASSALVILLAAPMQAQAQGKRGDREQKDDSQIVVTATGYELNVTKAPATISVITAEEIRARSYTDITDVLQNIPGVFVTGGGVEQSIMMRGMTSDYTLFLIDGKRVQDNQAFGLNGSQAGTPINFLPPLDAIQRIEVIRGPASSLYGSDAIGGVINIITKKVSNRFGGSFSAEYIKAGPGNDVTNDGLNASLAVNIPVIEDRMSIMLTGGARFQDEADFVGGGDSAAADPEFKRKNGGIKVNLRLDDNNTFTIGGEHTTQERRHNPGKSLAPTATASYSKSLRDNYFITHEGDFGDLIWQSYVTLDKSANPTRINATTGNSITFSTLVANTQAAWSLSNHKIVFGGTYRYEDLVDGATNGVTLPGIVDRNDIVTMERKQYAAFLEDNWEITDELSLLLSGRVDHNDGFGTQFSPKAYAVYSPTDSVTLKGGITTGYKVPALRTAAPDFGSTSMGGVIIGDPTLKPEKTLNYEIGASFASKELGVRTSLTGYKTEFTDKLQRQSRVSCNIDEPVCIVDGKEYPYHQYGYTLMKNIDSAELLGLEWTVDWDILKNLNYRHSYTFSKTEQTSGLYAGKPLNDMPKHMFNASVDWEATEKLNLWGQYNFRSKTTGRWVSSSGSASNGVQYPAYGFFNIGLGYEASRTLNLNLGLYNVTNKKVTPEDGFSYVLEGRRISAGINARF